MEEIPEDVLVRAGGGDRKAFRFIYEAVSGFVFSVAFRMTRNREDAEEVTQDVFIKVHRNLSRFGRRSAVKTWIYRITVNTALDLCRRRSRRNPERLTEESPFLETAVMPEAGKAMDRKSAEAALQRLLDCLKPEYRICIILREIEGLSYEEMAKVLKLNLNTVRSRLRRAREALVSCGKEVASHEL